MLLIFCAMSIGWLSGMGQLQIKPIGAARKKAARDALTELLFTKPRSDFIQVNPEYQDDLYCVPIYTDKRLSQSEICLLGSWFSSRSTLHVRGWIDGKQNQGQILPAEIFNGLVKYGKTTCFYDLTSISDIGQCVFPQGSIIRFMEPCITIKAQVEEIKTMIEVNVPSINITKRKNMLGIDYESYESACNFTGVFDEKAHRETKNLKNELAAAAEESNAERAPRFNRKQKIRSGIFSGVFGIFAWAINPVLYAFNYCGMCSSLTDFWTRTLFAGVTTGFAYMLISKKLFPSYKSAHVVAEWEEQEEEG